MSDPVRWELLSTGAYSFRGKTLLIVVSRRADKDGWYVTCEEARLEQVRLMDEDGGQACNEAIGMVADRLGWLARGWIRDLKGTKSLILDDLDPAGRTS